MNGFTLCLALESKTGYRKIVVLQVIAFEFAQDEWRGITITGEEVTVGNTELKSWWTEESIKSRDILPWINHQTDSVGG